MRAAILQTDSCARYDDPRTKTFIETVDKRNTVTLTVYHREVHRICANGDASAGLLNSIKWINPRALLSSILFAQHLRDRHRHHTRVGDMRKCIGKSQL